MEWEGGEEGEGGDDKVERRSKGDQKEKIC